jgi:hypothetical protein
MANTTGFIASYAAQRPPSLSGGGRGSLLTIIRSRNRFVSSALAFRPADLLEELEIQYLLECLEQVGTIEP